MQEMSPKDVQDKIQEAIDRSEEMVIALDFNVVLKDPDLMANFMPMAREFGHKVVLYKKRSNDMSDVEAQNVCTWTKATLVLITGEETLTEAMNRHNISPDVILKEFFKTKH